MKMNVSFFQQDCVKYFHRQYPKLSKLLVKNANDGYRQGATGRRAVAEGLTAGVADITLYMPYITAGFDEPVYHALLIELKIKPNKQTQSQKEWQQAVESFGYLYRVIYDFDSFKELIDNYIKGTL